MKKETWFTAALSTLIAGVITAVATIYVGHLNSKSSSRISVGETGGSVTVKDESVSPNISGKNNHLNVDKGTHLVAGSNSQQLLLDNKAATQQGIVGSVAVTGPVTQVFNNAPSNVSNSEVHQSVQINGAEKAIGINNGTVNGF